MPDRARIGILGGGGILGAHAPGFQQVADLCQVVAVAEPDTSEQTEYADEMEERLSCGRDYLGGLLEELQLA